MIVLKRWLFGGCFLCFSGDVSPLALFYCLFSFAVYFLFFETFLWFWFCFLGFPGAQMANSTQCRRPGFDPWVRRIPWRREWLPTPGYLPGEFLGQRILAGYSLWGHKELDMTEWLTLCPYKQVRKSRQCSKIPQFIFICYSWKKENKCKNYIKL